MRHQYNFKQGTQSAWKKRDGRRHVWAFTKINEQPDENTQWFDCEQSMLAECSAMERVTPFYSVKEDADDPHKLTDCEVFYMSEEEAKEADHDFSFDLGWYWRSCSPGCLPDDPTSIFGPFEKMDDAIADAREKVQ
tara:strand:+ start:230 stop:637 length:408 start_codon:yes stop_codon:yes gene_type:complete